MPSAAGNSSTPLAKKLGIKEDYIIRIINAPANYIKWLTDSPSGVKIVEERTSKKDFIHLFTTDSKELFLQLPLLKEEIKQQGMIWVSWPNKTTKPKTNITEDVISDLALQIGMVNTKVCEVDEVWAGLKLVIRSRTSRIFVGIRNYFHGLLIWLPVKINVYFKKLFFLVMSFVVFPLAAMLTFRFSQTYLPIIAQYIVLGFIFFLFLKATWRFSNENLLKKSEKMNKTLAYQPLIFALSTAFVGIYCFAALLSIFYRQGFLTIEPKLGKNDYELFESFFTYQLFDLIPELQIPETLKWKLPFTYHDSLTAKVVLLFKAIIALITIKGVFKWFEWKKKKDHLEGEILLPEGGGRMYYEIIGNGDPIVLIHGMAMDCRMWDAQFYELSKFFKVIRYDMRGFGKSSQPEATEKYSHHGDLNRLLVNLNISKTHVIGFAMGARVAIDFALMHAEKVKSLSVVSASLNGYLPETLSSEVFGLALKKGKKVANHYWFKKHLRKYPAVGGDPDLHQNNLMEELSIIGSSYSGWHWVEGKESLRIDSLKQEDLKKIIVPTFIYHGGRDKKEIKDAASVFKQHIPDCVDIFSFRDGKLFSDTGHFLTMEDPKFFNLFFFHTVSYVNEQDKSERNFY